MVSRLSYVNLYGIKRAIVNEIADILYTRGKAQELMVPETYSAVEIRRMLIGAKTLGLAFGKNKFDVHEIMKQARATCYQRYYRNGCKYA